MSMIGKTLGTFECTAQLGKGGMGEVYKAKDQKLGRDVAIKVLPEEFAKDADRVARFQREAKLLASLNHPNIAAIYGLEESDGTHFLVLELIEGDTLADQIKKGPIPAEESLKLALQIAEALEAAHEKGVIHRDLKPANIKITPDGKVKVLDFGLAKAFAGDSEGMDLSNSPTLSAAATQQGIILGTAAYMSPEQARGKTVDKRTDIWAFGVVLYEMITGHSAFQGEDVSVTLASVIKGDANLTLLPPSIHPRVREVITRCLQSDIKRRYSSVADAQYEIEQTLADPGGVLMQPETTAKPRKKLHLGLPWVAAAVILVAIIAALAGWNLKPPEPRRVMRFYHELPEDQRFTASAASAIDLSADGTQIVYVANDLLYLRSLSELSVKPIQGTDEDPIIPIFSPDGLWVAYYSFTDGQWKKITVSGGAPVILCDAGLPSGATWGPDNAILFVDEGSGIHRVSANGGTAEQLIKLKEGERFHRPQALPGGEWVLFTARSADTADWDEAQIVVQSLKTGERIILVSGGGDARYVPTGHIVYALGDVLYAKVFDIDSMEVKGGAVPIVEGVQRASVTGSANYGFSNTGMLSYIVEGLGTADLLNLVWVDRNGAEEPLGAESNAYRALKISPDGSRVAVTVGATLEQDIWIWDFARKTNTRLTFEKGEDTCPVWSPDGKRIAFHTHQKDARGSVYWKAADGTGKEEAVGSYQGQEIFPWSWSSDGKVLLVRAGYSAVGTDIGMLSMEGDHKYMPLLKETYHEVEPQISPDGRWMAYASDETGQPEVFVRPFPDVDSGGKWQVSANGGISPLWSPDGRELFYRRDDVIMTVPVSTDPAFSLGTPQELFRGAYYNIWTNTFWDIHPDGKRFLMMKEFRGNTSTEEASRPTINIVLNWFEELKERVALD